MCQFTPYYSPGIGRFISEDPIKDGLNWYTYCGNNPIMFIDPLGLEKIVVSGGAYDTKGGYDYEFIEPAVKKLNEWVDLNDGENITWIIADEGWSDNDKMMFKNCAATISDRINVKFISSKDELFDYINSKDDNSRYMDKVTKFVVFSHGLARDDGVISLGYNYNIDYNTNLDITKQDIHDKIWATAFDNPNTWFGSCNIGTSGDSSFAQVWVNKFGGTTWAFSGKSNYGNINDGASLKIKISRALHGFSYYGSANYPSAGRDAYLITFTRK